MKKLAVALNLPTVETVMVTRLLSDLIDKARGSFGQDIPIDLFIREPRDTTPIPLLPVHFFEDFLPWSGDREELEDAGYVKYYVPSLETAKRMCGRSHVMNGFYWQFELDTPTKLPPYLKLPKSPEGFLLHRLYQNPYSSSIHPFAFVDFSRSGSVDIDIAEHTINYMHNERKTPLVTYESLLPKNKQFLGLIRKYCVVRDTPNVWNMLVDMSISTIVLVYGNSWVYHVARTLRLPCVWLYASHHFDMLTSTNYAYNSDYVENINLQSSKTHEIIQAIHSLSRD